MQKPFKTINEQVKLLQARGLVINDIEQAEKYLLSNNYYNIINGYSKYFPRTGEQYTNGTTFEKYLAYIFSTKKLNNRSSKPRLLPNPT